MKQTVTVSAVLPRSRPGDRVIRVTRRRRGITGFINSIASILHIGSPPKAR